MHMVCWLVLAVSTAGQDLASAYPDDLGQQLPLPRGCGSCLRLGVAIALSEETLLLADDGQRDGPPEPGMIASYQRHSGDWYQQAILTAPNPLQGDLFGRSIDSEGTRVVVGAPGDPIGGPAGGSAWLLTQTPHEWLIEAHFAPSEPMPGGQFGSSVAMAGEFVAVGAPYHDIGGAWDVGRVEIFQAKNAGWERIEVLDPLELTTSMRFGTTLAFSRDGQTLCIGAPGFDTPVDRAGAVYTATRDTAGTWELSRIIQRARPTPLDRFGMAIATSSQHVLVGIPGSDIGAPNAGALALLDPSNPTRVHAEWIEPSSAGAYLGYVLASSEALVCAAMPGATTPEGHLGYVRIFRIDAGKLLPVLDIAAQDDMAPLGNAIAVDGNRIVVTSVGTEDGVPQPGRAWFIELDHYLASNQQPRLHRFPGTP